jgi:glycosyltransferase involved in cell wall biosynthesis
MGVVIGQEAPPDRRFAITAPTPCWPVLEALACGTPAVVPSGGVARELVGAAGTGPPPDRTGAAWRLARSAAGAVFPAARPACVPLPEPPAGCGGGHRRTAVGLADGVRSLLDVPAADRAVPVVGDRGRAARRARRDPGAGRLSRRWQTRRHAVVR